MKVYKTSRGDVLDEIVFRHYGATGGYLEAVYEANRHLSDYPDKFPEDLEISLPDIKVTKTTREVSLWD